MNAPTHEHTLRPMVEVLDDELLALQSAGLRRSLRAVQERRAGTVLLDGDRIADFASNDYLGLAADHRVARAATAVLQAEGTGAGAARLISGNHPIHDTLERELARFKQCDAALLFPSGYMVNIGVIPALVGEGDVIYSDALNHASLVDGCRLAKATLRVFPHANLDALRTMLETDRGAFRRALIVVEGIFSMDGDLFPLDGLVPLAHEFGAWTYVDDAHGTGVLGEGGKGSIERFGVAGQIDVVVGTLGKALGTSGAFVGGSQVLIEYMTSRARSFIFTTGTPPALAAATLEALRLAQVEGWRRDTVRARARHLRDRLRNGGRPIPGIEDGHILPILVGDATRTMQIVAELRRRGFLVGGVRPPTVAPGTSRLRVSVSALHPPELVDSLAANLLDVLRGGAGMNARFGPGAFDDFDDQDEPDLDEDAFEADDDTGDGADADVDSPDLSSAQRMLMQDAAHVWHPYTQHHQAPMPIPIVRASGQWLYDADDRPILDAISSWWVTTHGHCQPEIVDAIAEQARTLDQVIFAGFTHEPAALLAAALVSKLPRGLSRIFYSDNGSTAVEVAIKLSLQSFANRGQPRRLVAALEHAYHGDTFGAMAAGARGVFTQMYEPLLFEVARLPDPSEGNTIRALDALIASRGHELAAVIVEPLVLGAGGMRVWDERVLRQIREKTAAAGIHLIADEVMTGFGRTGPLFACERADVSPDLLCMSKGLTGGILPLGATAATEAIFDAFLDTDRSKTFFHGHSYTANPLACAAALASLALFDEESEDHRIRIEVAHARHLEALRGRRGVKAVRQLGTIAAVELAGTAGYLSEIGRELAAFAIGEGVLLRPLGNVAYVLPPYCTSDDDLARIYEVIERFVDGERAAPPGTGGPIDD